MRRMALGLRPVVITIHSFTPVYFGQPRAVEFGVIHDADPALAQAIVAEARAQTPLKTELNEEIKAIETQVMPQGQQWLDTKAAMVEISPATLSVPAQTAEYTEQMQPPVPALTADGKPADDPGGPCHQACGGQVGRRPG